MSSTIDQKSYLQKYLSGPSKDKKKKKKKVVKGKGFKIIDDDIDLSKLRPLDGDELDILDQGEDAPQIAGIVDERPEELRKMEQFKTGSKWRVINEDDGFNSKLQIQEIKKDVKVVEKENEIIFGKMYSDSEDEKQNNDSDLSPPRKATKKQDNDSDLSPPRKRGQSPRKDTNVDSDPSPPRKYEAKKERSRKPSRWGDAEVVTTSPKKKESKSNRSSSPDQSPPRKNNFDSDQSPPRKRKPSPQSANKYSKDLTREKDRRELSDRNRNGSERDKKTYRRDSPVRSKRESDSDLSPPRKDKYKKSQTKNRSPSPKNSRRKHNSEYDSPRKSRKSRKSPDMNSDSDLSPPRKNKRKASPKNRRDSDSDLSPPRREKDKNRNSNNMALDRDKSKYRNSDSPPPTNKKMAKTLEGKQAGLQDARQLREENEEFRKKEDEVFKRLGDDVSGRNAKAVSRKGKRDTSQERQKQREKAERQKELDAKYKLWSKGMKQVEAQEARLQDFIHEASKPLARHKDDKDLEHSLKHVERAGDPMMNYIRERQRERGELPPEKPSYKGNFPPNRFNIRPGYRWDGVDRSNGYENKYFQQQSKRKAQEEEAYKWSTEDL